MSHASLREKGKQHGSVKQHGEGKQRGGEENVKVDGRARERGHNPTLIITHFYGEGVIRQD